MSEIFQNIIKAIRDWSNSKFQPKGNYLTEVPEEYALVENTGNSLSLSIDSDYVMTLELKNADGNVLSSKNIDFPIESMVIGASYADGELFLTLQNGQELPPIDISDIVNGLVNDTFTIAGIDMKDDITKEELVTALGINNKVDKVEGKGLSSNDYTTEDKDKLSAIESGAEVNVQPDWNDTDANSDAFIKNKPTIPTKTSDLTNDSNFASTVSPTFTGEPKAPTAQSGTNNTQIATTAFANATVKNHNESTTAHDDIRELIVGLTTRLNAIADSDDTTLDQLSEIVAYIKANRSLIDSITTSKINVDDIIDNLTSTATNKPLSANQGKVLNDLIYDLVGALEGDIIDVRDILENKLDKDAEAVSSITADKLDGLHAKSFIGNNTGFIRPNHVGGSTNANDYVTEWHGFVYNMSNLPQGKSYGFLDVTWFDGFGFSPSPQEKGGVVRQVFTVYNTAEIYIRVRYDNNWTSWKVIAFVS